MTKEKCLHVCTHPGPALAYTHLYPYMCTHTPHICRKKCSDSFESFNQVISLYVLSEVYRLGPEKWLGAQEHLLLLQEAQDAI